LDGGLVLETERLLIRDVGVGDSAGFFEYMRHVEYWCHVPVEPVTRDSVDLMVRRAVLDRGKNPRSDYFLAVLEKRSERIVGEAILHIRSARWGQGEIGWGVDHRRAGDGIATEIGSAMLELGFQQLGLHRIYAQCRVENLASRRIMMKLGMTQEGILRENVLARGEWWWSAQYSVLSTD
jgi:[ribosomal protein S5]-alanine N-acetyltransferase